MTRIKFCGLCRPEDAAFASEVGATFGGVILTDSKRKVTVDDARRIFDAAPELKRVGVVAREPVSWIIDAAREAELDVLQLHARVSHDDFARLREEFEGNFWSVIGVDVETGVIPDSWIDLADASDALLLDTSVAGVTGGTGRTFDWASAANIIRQISREVNVVLAGGLRPENVADAIRKVHPWAVDVSSGIESSPWAKSRELMSAFANAVRSASIV